MKVKGGLVRKWEGWKVRRFREGDPPSLLIRCAEQLGPLRLVPIHTPRPLRRPLRGLGLGCLRTRAMTPAHPIHRVPRGWLSAHAGGLGSRMARS